LVKNSRSKIRDEEELRVFRSFCIRSHIGIVPGSIEKRSPPEPDILCRLEDGTTLAFELVEVCDPQNARFFGGAPLVARALEETYRDLPDELRARFTLRFASKPLSFSAPDASLNRIRRTLPRIFEELVNQPETDGQFCTFSKAVERVLVSVRLVGRVDTPDCPSFNLAGSFQPDDVVVECLRSKLNRNYKTPHPVELLAYFGGLAWGKSALWKVPLESLLQSNGFGPFRRVWVLDWNDVAFVYPSIQSDGYSKTAKWCLSKIGVTH
jgi:hypothetical protein